MATRSETLDRLAVVSPGSEAWDGMAGDERRVSPLAATFVTARNRRDRSQRFAVSEADGSYRFDSLLPGVYDLTGATALPVDPPRRPLDASPRGEAGR